MALSVKDRVFAAAEQISVERRPTVSTVRAAAGVSNADATRYLKEWTEEKHAAGGQVAATPPAILEQAARLAGAVWTEASSVANERHQAAEELWAREKKELNEEVAELVADLDVVTAEKESVTAELASQIEELKRQLAVNIEQLEQARAAQQEATSVATAATTRAAAAEARAEALQEAHDSLLARITPQQPSTGEEPEV
ncbi:DNA-binding protein [Arthrobacter sp. SAFR-179]|uniref:DNA-binding protein n=1 Tax=Arthrobacter sp. SAFR-179 TaxID=3387279 RepID=UPI003F7BDDA6